MIYLIKYLGTIVNYDNSIDWLSNDNSYNFKGKPGIPTVADGKVGAELTTDASENIPLRIMYVLISSVPMCIS